MRFTTIVVLILALAALATGSTLTITPDPAMATTASAGNVGVEIWGATLTSTGGWTDVRFPFWFHTGPELENVQLWLGGVDVYNIGNVAADTTFAPFYTFEIRDGYPKILELTAGLPEAGTLSLDFHMIYVTADTVIGMPLSHTLEVNAVPEPFSAGLTGLGIIGLTALFRRRQKAASR